MMQWLCCWEAGVTLISAGIILFKYSVIRKKNVLHKIRPDGFYFIVTVAYYFLTKKTLLIFKI